MKHTLIVMMLLAASAAMAQGTAKKQERVLDPVCGMEVDPKTTADKSVYKGKTYYFCARSEKEAFDKAPEKYVAQGKKK